MYTKSSSRVLLAVVLWFVCMAASPTEAAEEMPSANEESTCAIWLGESSSEWVRAVHWPGTIDWNATEGRLSGAFGLVRQILWIPSESYRKEWKGEGEPTAPNVKDYRGFEFVLQQEQADRWHVEKAQELPSSGSRSLAPNAVHLGRMIHMILCWRAGTLVQVFDSETIKEGSPSVFEMTPFITQGAQKEPEFAPRSAADFILVRQNKYAFEVAAIYYDQENKARAVFANIGVAGIRKGLDGPMSLDERAKQKAAIAQEAVYRVKAFFLSIEDLQSIDDEVFVTFLKEWNAWRTDVGLEIQLFDTKSATDDGTATPIEANQSTEITEN